MGPDYLFLIAGALVGLCAVFVAVLGRRRKKRMDVATVGLLVILSAGLAVQGLAPNLRIERNSFILPAPKSGSVVFESRSIVDRERQMKVLSALLVGVGGLGLLLRHRRLFLGAELMATNGSSRYDRALEENTLRDSPQKVLG